MFVVGRSNFSNTSATDVKRKRGKNLFQQRRSEIQQFIINGKNFLFLG